MARGWKEGFDDLTWFVLLHNRLLKRINQSAAGAVKFHKEVSTELLLILLFFRLITETMERSGMRFSVCLRSWESRTRSEKDFENRIAS